MPQYDLLILGGGPAGLAAGIFGARARLKTVILEKSAVGGMAFTTRDLVNYPGFYEKATGPDLMKKMSDHAKAFGVEIIKENVTEIELEGDVKKIRTKKGLEYTAQAVILATGSQPRRLNIPGEKKLRGCGVSYCATCDADFYNDLKVLVVGNGDSAIEEAMFIAKFASKVYILVIHDEGVVDCNKISAEKAFKNEKIEFIWNAILSEIKGKEEVEGAVIKHLKTGVLSDLDVDGVFIYIGMVPQTEMLREKLELDGDGYIITNDMMETSQEGVYAAGDVCSKYLRQVVTSVNDGAIAAVAAERYISEQEYIHQNVLQKDKPVLLFFWNPSNQECIDAMSLSEQFAEKSNGRLDVVKIDVSRKKNIADKYGVSSTPTAILLNKGQVLCDLSKIPPVCWDAEIKQHL